MEFGLLGPLLVRRDEAIVPIPAARQRVLLAALLLKANQVISADALVEFIWGAEPPATARKTMHNYVKRLRRALGDTDRSRIITRSGGYLISVGVGELDVTRFETLHGEARAFARHGNWPEASARLRTALALWRGAPLADVPSDPLLAQVGLPLAEMRLQALEDHIEADLHLGLHDEILIELQRLTSVEPMRERLHALLMLALYRAGRQAESLAAYRAVRRLLVSELATEPGPDLRQLHLQIQRADPALTLPPVISAEHFAGQVAPMIPRQLPAAPAHFTGRARELETLTELLDQAAGTRSTIVISAIGGTAGIGKTSLAVHWAHRAAERFGDGQLYVNLRGFDPTGTPVTPARAIRCLLDGLGIPAEQIPGSLEAQVGLYRSLLAGKRMLVLLDNARTADQVRPLLPGSADSLVLVTSRSQLTSLAAIDGATLIALDVLSETEAEELLASHIGARRMSAEPPAVADLIALCARLPLALSIAAARASARPSVALSTLARELRDSHSRLDALDAGDAASNLRTVFSWSYLSLSPEGARMFRLLGVHPGPDITAPAAASLAGDSLRQAGEALNELTMANLVAEHAPGRYAFHDLLRAYAAEQASAPADSPEHRAAIHRVLDHYLHTAAAANRLLNPARDPIDFAPPHVGAGPQELGSSAQAQSWFETEHSVLLAMIGLAAEHRFDAHAWQLPWALTDFFDWQGHWRDWIATQRTAVTTAQRLGDRAAQARAYRSLGDACSRLGYFDEAHAHLTQALSLFHEVGDHIGEARAHQALSWLLDRQGQPEQALAHDQVALRLYEDTGHRKGQANALNAIGWLQAQLGEHQQALDYCGKALDLHHELGNRRGEAATWDSLGYARHHIGQHSQAISCYRRALDLFRDLGDRYNQAEILTHIGDAHRAARDLRAARETWGEAFAILHDLDHPDAHQVRERLDNLDAANSLPDRALATLVRDDG
jgi:DNA-binding SARP family transcriptional activator/tetratricopeptide (TPR) repeat protein